MQLYFDIIFSIFLPAIWHLVSSFSQPFSQKKSLKPVKRVTYAKKKKKLELDLLNKMDAKRKLETAGRIALLKKSHNLSSTKKKN